MMKNILHAFAFLGLFGTAVTSFATTHTITQEGLTFAPIQLNVEVGDVVVFQWTSGQHTTTSAVVPAGADSWDAPLNMSSPTFEYTVEAAGVYAYVCTPHVGAGMVGGFTAVLPNNVASHVPANLSVSAGTSSQGQLFVQLQNAMTDMAKLTLVDITGRIVATLYEGPIGDAEFAVRHDVSTLQRGIYFVRFDEGARVVTRKVLLQ